MPIISSTIEFLFKLHACKNVFWNRCPLHCITLTLLNFLHLHAGTPPELFLRVYDVLSVHSLAIVFGLSVDAACFTCRVTELIVKAYTYIFKLTQRELISNWLDYTYTYAYTLKCFRNEKFNLRNPTATQACIWEVPVKREPVDLTPRILRALFVRTVFT